MGCIVKCNPSFTANCWYRGSTVVHCPANQYWDGNHCRGCPAYARCQHGIIKMQTVRSTYRHGASATQTFYFRGVNFNQCRIRVDARQTDYDWHHEWLSIRHVDNSYQNLASRCGFNQQCHQNLRRCSLSTNTVYVDHGANDQITIQGVNSRYSDYCPYNPVRDLAAQPQPAESPGIRCVWHPRHRRRLLLPVGRGHPRALLVNIATWISH